jgi:hypothetical protein
MSELPPEVTAPEEKRRRQRPAVVINIQSWATPIVGIVMLVVGLFLGYMVSPSTVRNFGKSALPTTNKTPAVQESSTTPAAPVLMTSEPTADIMAYLVSQTRHFKGDETAPVTIIEFSDYQ